MSGWPEIEAALDAMLDRRWYTNHGPAAQTLERRLELAFGVPHAVIATNPVVAAMMVLDALGRTGAVLLPCRAPSWWGQAVRWAGMDAVAYEGGTAASAAEGWDEDVSVVVLGAEGDVAGIAAWAAARDLAVIGGRSGAEPAVVRLPCPCDPAGLGCVVTSDGALAARLRNIRSSYGAGPPVAVVRTVNGRVSEAQAALALLELERGGWAAEAERVT